MTDFVKAVKDHALANYEEGGWDFIVECWEDEDILKAIAGAKSAEEAIAKVAETAGLLDERRQEARAESGEY